MTINTVTLDHHPVVRVGHSPEPWAWTDWKYGAGHRFDGRWDDPQGAFRVLYASDSLRGCLLELLATYRPDPSVSDEMAKIQDDDSSTTNEPGVIDLEWAKQRRVGVAQLSGSYCQPTQSGSIAHLRSALHTDLDAATLRDAEQREITQAAARSLYQTTVCDGIAYGSRHGDEEQLWAVFERTSGTTVDSTRLNHMQSLPLLTSHPEVVEVFELYGLRWEEAPDELPAPVVEHDTGHWRRHAFPASAGQPTTNTPLGSVFLWLNALHAGGPQALAALTYHPIFWSRTEYDMARNLTKGLALTHRHEPVTESLPPSVAAMSQVYMGHRSLASAASAGALEFFGPWTDHGPNVHIAVVLDPAGIWKVAGIGLHCQMRPEVLNDPDVPRVLIQTPYSA